MHTAAITADFDTYPQEMREYDATRFLTANRASRFEIFFQTKRIIYERGLALEDFAGEERDWGAIAARIGWKQLFTFGGLAAIDPVLEFYSNALALTSTSITSWVRGRIVSISLNDIYQFFDLPFGLPLLNAPSPVTEAIINDEVLKSGSDPKKLNIGLLKLEYIPLARMMLKNVIPSIRESHVSLHMRQLLYLVGTETPFDIAGAIFGSMTDFLRNNSPQACCPFGVFITANLIKQGVKIDSDERWIHSDPPLTREVISKARAHRGAVVTEASTEDVAGPSSGRRKRARVEVAIEEQTQAASTQAQAPVTTDRLDELFGLVRDLGTRMDAFAREQTMIRQELGNLSFLLRRHIFGSDTSRPPPPQ